MYSFKRLESILWHYFVINNITNIEMLNRVLELNGGRRISAVSEFVIRDLGLVSGVTFLG